MGISQIIAGVTAFVTGLVPMSCHKVASNPNAKPATTAVAAANPTNDLHNLGEIVLTNHYERCVSLGGGKDCLLVPRSVDGKNLELSISLESYTADGQTMNLMVTQVTTKAGKPVDIALGDYQIQFTPKLQ
jgi:hypothetical protein